MGVCGMGTMVAIDYENGDSNLLASLDSTLNELGVERQSIGTKVDAELQIDDGASEFTTIPTAGESSEVNTTAPPSKKPKKLVDVRERMRVEAASEEEQTNPWLNMASYLAKKASDTMFGA